MKKETEGNIMTGVCILVIAVIVYGMVWNYSSIFTRTECWCHYLSNGSVFSITNDFSAYSNYNEYQKDITQIEYHGFSKANCGKVCESEKWRVEK